MVKDLCFEIIETCPNNCVFCSSNSNCNKKQMVAFDAFRKTIDHFLETGGIEELSLSGGEPFFHPELMKMVAYAKSNGIRTIIFTSGVTRGKPFSEEEIKMLLKEKNERLKEMEEQEPDNDFLKERVSNFYDSLIQPKEVSSIPRKQIKELIELGLDKIVFDYQAYEEETDHSLMGRKEENRQALLNSMITASLLGLEVDVHFVPMKPNYKEIKDILEMLEIAEIKNISILNFLPQGRGKLHEKELQLSEEEKQEFFQILESASFKGNIRIGISLQEEQTHKCNAGLEKLDIRYDGTVLPCPAFKDITEEECKRYGISLPNIYTNLEDVHIPGKGTRVKPLCKQIYAERRQKA